MYAYIKGEIIDVTEDNLVIEANNGIGYNVKIPLSVAAMLPGYGNDIKIYTYTCVREDAFMLYGFLTNEDCDIFKKLITVNGIGPKGALSILSTMTTDNLRFAIISGDSKSIARAPGVGAKSAERIIIDLKDKISLDLDHPAESQLSLLSEEGVPLKKKKNVKKEENPIDESLIAARNDAIEALVSLGYAAADALKAVKQIGDLKDMDAEAILKAALKNIVN